MATPMLARAANQAANIDQCRNGTIAAPVQCADSGWVNGNLGETNSHYREGDSVPFRATLTNMVTSGTHTLVIGYDRLQSGKHAYDYLTSYNRTETDADPTTGLTSLTAGNCFVIPVDPNIAFANPGSTQASGCIQIWNGTITNITYGTSEELSDQRTVTVTFTASDPTVLIAWGGHIASQIDWGAGNSAGAISGSPYHMRLITLDSSSLGNQDRSLKAAAILPVPAAFTTQANPSQVTLGQGTASDTATLSGTNGNVTGTVAFFVCFSASSNPDCTSGGTPVGSAKTLVVGQSSSTAQSDAYTPLAPGFYCFRGEYTPDAFAAYSPSNHTDQTNECFQVVPPTTTLTTNAGGPYTIGANGTVNLSDIAHLAGGTSNAGGTITFKLFSDANCQTQVGSDVTASVSGADGKDYTSPSISVSAAGTYHWTASYNGDANNSGSSSGCGAASENPVVNPRSTSLTTDAGGPYTIGAGGTATLFDIAHLAGGTSNAGGTITFKLYSDANCQTQVGSTVTASANGADGKDYASPAISVSAAGTYHWTASYDGDTNNTGSSSGCGADNENPVVNPRSTSLTTDAGGPYSLGAGGSVNLTDTATLSGGASNASGTITFKLFSDANCQTQVGSDVTKSVNGADGDQYTSPAISVAAAGTYHWTASYDGDTNNTGSSSGCGADNENPVVNPQGTSVSTDAGGPYDIGPDGTVDLTDVATLSGGTSNASGMLTFQLFSDANCQTQVGSDVTKSVNGADGDQYTSPAITVDAAGTYHWVVAYSGDGNNNGSASACGADNENPVVNKLGTSLSTDAGGPYNIGADGTVDLADTATLSGGTSNAKGTITFKLFSDANCQTQVGSDVTKSVNGADGDQYTSPAITVSAAGTYHWTASYNGETNNSDSASACGDDNENPVVNKLTTSLTTNAGGTHRVGEDGTVDLTDTAHLSGGTSNAGGTITFKLYGPDSTPNSSEGDCSPENLVGTATATVDGADGVDYVSSPAITVTEPGTYHWTASYDGDTNNSGSSSSCGAEGENPVVIQPQISVSKTPDEQVIRNGGTATWTIEVINDGSSTLTDVHVTDEQAPGCARTSQDIEELALMAPGAHVSYTCSLANNTASFTNVAVATGTPDVGEDVSAEDTAHVTVIHPHISVSKTPDTQTVAFAGTATFTINVVNDGDSTLTNVRVTDAQAPGCSRTSAELPQLASMAPGDHLAYTCTLASVTANFTNVAVATGTPQVGPDVTANDSAAVTVGPPPPPVTHPAISIVKDPKSQVITRGGTANFKITVTNTGDVALTNVTVSDPRSPNCNRSIGTLAPGASFSYTCKRANVQASFDNVGVATGTAGSTTVTAQDTAPVTAKAPFVPKKVVPKVVSHKKPKVTG